MEPPRFLSGFGFRARPRSDRRRRRFFRDNSSNSNSSFSSLAYEAEAEPQAEGEPWRPPSDFGFRLRPCSDRRTAIFFLGLGFGVLVWRLGLRKSCQRIVEAERRGELFAG